MVDAAARIVRNAARILGAVSLVFIPASLLAASPAGPVQWVTAWMTALQAIPESPSPSPLYHAPLVAGRTVREIVVPTLDGSSIALHVSNRFSGLPLTIRALRIAPAQASARLAGPGSAVTFAGEASVTLGPGAEATSDPVEFAVKARTPYAVSVAVGDAQKVAAWHRVANETIYISTVGDHSTETGNESFTGRSTHLLWVTGLDVQRTHQGAIVALGDSITDGMGARFGSDGSWPSQLAALLAQQPGLAPGILNAGISGNRLLSDSACYGERLIARFARDIEPLHGVGSVIVLIGINDINFAAVPARRPLDCDAPHRVVDEAMLEEGLGTLIEQAHRRGLRIYLATLTPADLPTAREALRVQLNRWIRSNTQSDGFVDFDAALSDPAAPSRLRAQFDSGDRIHPNNEGYAALAKAALASALVNAN
jgi:lysophospholipase L1-like esterase